MFNRGSFCTCPSFADFICSETGLLDKMESVYQNSSHPEYPDVVELLPGREDSCLEWERSRGYCKTCQEFYQGSEMTVGSRKRVSRHWNMSGKINFACGLGDILRHSKILCVIESCICLDYLSNQPCLSMSHRISRS